MAAEFSSTVEKAVTDRRICGGAAIAIDKSGRVIVTKEFGKTSVETDAQNFTLDTALWLASSTKLLTSISALQCVEKGLLKLDEDISSILPAWKDPEILTGFDSNGKPTLVKAKQTITLRRLLTHSSGMCYSGMDPRIGQYRRAVGLDDPSTDPAPDSIQSEKNPLLFEPGSGWMYSPSIDWAGQMVEAVTGLTLGQYMQKNIFDPLGMTSTTFDPVGNASIMSRMTGRVGRDPATGLVKKEESKDTLVRNRPDHWGGSGLYSTANDYIKVLKSLLLDDGKLLAKGGEMYEQLFKPQLENPAAFKKTATNPVMGPFLAPGLLRDPERTDWDHTLGGAVVKREIPGHAALGTLFWSGYSNNYWFVDRVSGTAGHYASWILPPGDAPTGEMFAAFQQAALKQISAKL